MPSEHSAWETASVLRVLPVVRPRKLARVPFVELAEGRLQGVVSSGSDIARVYVSSVTADGHGISCSTNNNRPCGGLRGPYLCKHLGLLVDEAVVQYGRERVARFLNVDPAEEAEVIRLLHPVHEPAPAAAVFSRFLRYLAYLELADTTVPVPEMDWFPATAVGA